MVKICPYCLHGIKILPMTEIKFADSNKIESFNLKKHPVASSPPVGSLNGKCCKTSVN